MSERSLWCCTWRPQHRHHDDAASVAVPRGDDVVVARPNDMGAALTHEDVVDGVSQQPHATMAAVIRERKKKCAGGGGLSTLRRRLGAVRRARACARQDRESEHARHIRSVVSSWRPAEVAALHEEYETLHALRDLTTQAELARCPAGTLHADLAALYTDRFCAEATLVWRGASFAVHRSILSARCPYLRDVLNAYPGSNARIVLEGLPYSMTPADLDSVLLIIYAGEEGLRLIDSQASNSEEQQCQPDLDILSTDQSHNGRAGLSWRRGGDRPSEQVGVPPRQLAEQLGVAPSRLARDLARILHDGTHADAALVFSSEAAHGFRSKLELPCHRAILAARSPFFRSVIRRLLASSPSHSGAGGSRNARVGGACSVLRVAVDESVLPRRLARALLHAAYTDQLDLSLISRNTSPGGTGQMTSSSSHFGGYKQLEDACELYEIARFLEMAIVSQRCEDAIVETLSTETLPHILRWASQEHASKWVYRQAMRYLREEFVSLCCTANPCLLEREHMAAALQSNYLQASEAQALRALIRWGERTLAGWSMDAQGNGGKGRRGARRPPADALRAHIAPLLPHLRLQHLQPTNVLQQAIRRGILPESYASVPTTTSDAWLGRPPHRPARLFMPYYDEIKALLEDQNVNEAEVMQLRRGRCAQQIPDALYMVTSPEAACGGALASLRARVRELCALARPLAPHAAPKARAQLALRAARERDLPDALARHIAPETPPSGSDDENAIENRPNVPLELDVCMPSSSGQANLNDQRYGLTGTLSVRVPDVAVCGVTHATPPPLMPTRVATQPTAAAGQHSAAPHAGLFNANTHLLSTPYCRGIFTPWRELTGGVLQLDLGDGATHAPRAGSRASRARRGQTAPITFAAPANEAASLQSGVAHDPQTPSCSGAYRSANDSHCSASTSKVNPIFSLNLHAKPPECNPLESYPLTYKDPYGQGTSYGARLTQSRRDSSKNDENMSSRDSTLERLNHLQMSRDNTLERLKELDRYDRHNQSRTNDFRLSSLGREGSRVGRHSPGNARDLNDPYAPRLGHNSPCSSLGRLSIRRDNSDLNKDSEVFALSPQIRLGRNSPLSNLSRDRLSLRRENSDLTREKVPMDGNYLGHRLGHVSPCSSLGRERMSPCAALSRDRLSFKGNEVECSVLGKRCGPYQLSVKMEDHQAGLRLEGVGQASRESPGPSRESAGPGSPRRRRELSAFRPVHSAFNSPAYSNRSPGSSRGHSPASYS